MTNKTVTTPLHPCPFCGCEVQGTQGFDYIRVNGAHGISCPFLGDDPLITEADGWNTRAVPTVERQEPVVYLRNEGIPNNLVLCTFTCPGAFGVYRRPTLAALSLPERRQPKHYWGRPGKLTAVSRAAAEEWNACLDAVKELNQ